MLKKHLSNPLFRCYLNSFLNKDIWLALLLPFAILWNYLLLHPPPPPPKPPGQWTLDICFHKIYSWHKILFSWADKSHLASLSMSVKSLFSSTTSFFSLSCFNYSFICMLLLSFTCIFNRIWRASVVSSFTLYYLFRPNF